MDLDEHQQWVHFNYFSSLSLMLPFSVYAGWNSWYNFGCNYNEQMIRDTVDIIVSTGLASLGYQYSSFVLSSMRMKTVSLSLLVNLDDCWQVSRDASGRIQADPKAFPNGLQTLIDYVHSRGLKFGLYSGLSFSLTLSMVESLILKMRVTRRVVVDRVR